MHLRPADERLELRISSGRAYSRRKPFGRGKQSERTTAVRFYCVQPVIKSRQMKEPLGTLYSEIRVLWVMRLYRSR